MRLVLGLVLAYVAAGVSANAFLFHLPVWIRGRDPSEERLRLAASIPPLAELIRRGDPSGAERAVVLGIVFLWPLFLVPLARWMATMER